MLVEVCANSLQSALNTQEAGADRIELCSELAVGGITPSYGLLKAVRDKIKIPVNVLIRPRSGDFTFSSDEFEIMKTNIELCRELGFNGIVSGVLHPDCSLDVDRTRELIAASGDLTFTFHRAFDWVNDPVLAVEQLADLGVATILSSGQQTSAVLGMELLIKLQMQTQNVVIMPGSGINQNNAPKFKRKGFKALHLSAARFCKTLEVEPKVPMNSSSFLFDNGIAVSNLEILTAVVKAVK
ncbi:copper homeostasis protein CutC [Maribacter antarcticus]|uniref:copper homeostasis protein CutC n=1 Tax=Maribacter antarcticus TaxID=505250 RepID=UPI000479C793|nr:copper homeostasis protein CutC [Maribacter antarcticus]